MLAQILFSTLHAVFDLNSMRVGLVVSGLDTGFSQVIKNVLKFNRGCELYL